MRIRPFSPFWLPVWFFLGTILLGASLLSAGFSHSGGDLSWLDALFTATSAMCITGLAVVDTGSFFSLGGQTVILALIQLGGLGIMTYTTLALFLIGRRVSLTDRIAVGESLLHDPTFRLGKFVMRIVIGTLTIEAAGAAALFLLDPHGFAPYSAVFHSVSAFCNAGFALQADSLTPWAGNLAVNLVFMILIILGGLGFAVLDELRRLLMFRMSAKGRPKKNGALRLSWHARVVLRTSFLLVVAGAAIIFFAEWAGGEARMHPVRLLLTSLFQSVTCRTAGFNTVEISHLTNVSLVFMMGLMFIGGSPGSCAGGIKTTTFRAWWGMIVSHVKGLRQVRIGRYALSPASANKALTLILFASLFILMATLILIVAEGGDVPHPQSRGLFLEVLFEAFSALGTVGLSTGLTPNLTASGKVVVIVLMFVGRVGPIWLLSGLQEWQVEQRYSYPEAELPFG